MGEVTIGLLADHPHLIGPVGEMRWREWGRPPEPTERDWWVDLTAREVGRRGLPATWVAFEDGRPVGAVGIGEFDIDEIQDRSPWVLGMVVEQQARRRGVGTALIESLLAWSRAERFAEVWVATEQARAFYERCGFEYVGTIEKESGDVAAILRVTL